MCHAIQPAVLELDSIAEVDAFLVGNSDGTHNLAAMRCQVVARRCRDVIDSAFGDLKLGLVAVEDES